MARRRKQTHDPRQLSFFDIMANQIEEIREENIQDDMREESVPASAAQIEQKQSVSVTPEAETKKEEEKRAEKKKRGLPKLTKEEKKDLISTALSALRESARRACKRLRIDPLEILVVFGGSDPAEIAQTYGYANAMMWGLMPHLEDIFLIPEPSLHLRMDYSAEKTRAEGSVGCSLRIRDGLRILIALLWPLLKWYLRYKKAHKNDAPAEKPTESAQPNHEHNEKMTA